MIRWVLLLAGLAALAACSSTPRTAAMATTVATTAAPAALITPQGVVSPLAANRWHSGWQPVALPGKRPTLYRTAAFSGRAATHAAADGSASMLRWPVRRDAAALQAVRFSWWVPALIEQADVSQRDADDAPVRVVLAFDGDHARLSSKNQMLFELARALTGETPPYATLMYVWDNRAPLDSVFVNGRTDRIRSVVVESGPHNLQRWLEYRRDIVGDYRKAFGEEPGPLIAVAIMTDADNTQSQVQAWYGDVELD